MHVLNQNALFKLKKKKKRETWYLFYVKENFIWHFKYAFGLDRYDFKFYPARKKYILYIYMCITSESNI